MPNVPSDNIAKPERRMQIGVPEQTLYVQVASQNPFPSRDEIEHAVRLAVLAKGYAIEDTNLDWGNVIITQSHEGKRSSDSLVGWVSQWAVRLPGISLK